MTVAEFQDLVLEHGDRLSTWAENQQNEARALLAISAEAAAVLAEAGRLREAILAKSDIKAPDGLKNRIFLAAFGSSLERRPPISAAEGHRRCAGKVAAQV